MHLSECPFFKKTIDNRLYCEHNRVDFDTRKELLMFARTNCEKLNTCVFCDRYNLLMQRYGVV